jgi:hypothetical protein
MPKLAFEQFRMKNAARERVRDHCALQRWHRTPEQRHLEASDCDLWPESPSGCKLEIEKTRRLAYATLKSPICGL